MSFSIAYRGGFANYSAVNFTGSGASMMYWLLRYRPLYLLGARARESSNLSNGVSGQDCSHRLFQTCRIWDDGWNGTADEFSITFAQAALSR